MEELIGGNEEEQTEEEPTDPGRGGGVGSLPSDNFEGTVDEVDDSIEDVSYDPATQQITITLPNGVVVQLPHDPENGNVIQDPDGTEYTVDP